MQGQASDKPASVASTMFKHEGWMMIWTVLTTQGFLLNLAALGCHLRMCARLFSMCVCYFVVLFAGCRCLSMASYRLRRRARMLGGWSWKAPANGVSGEPTTGLRTSHQPQIMCILPTVGYLGQTGSAIIQRSAHLSLSRLYNLCLNCKF